MCYNDNKDCSICIDNINEEFILECNHSFCKDCIYNWLKKSQTCPLCRNEVKEVNNYGFGTSKPNIIKYKPNLYIDTSVNNQQFIEQFENNLNWNVITTNLQDYQMIIRILELEREPEWELEPEQ